MSYHRAKRASLTERVFRMSQTRDDTMKLGFHDLNTYAYERRIWPTQLGGQLWGTRDSFLPTRPLPFDNTLRTSLDMVRHSRPSSSYSRVYDPTESALRALPYGTWPVKGEFYRDYIAAWLGPILEFTFAHQRCINAWIVAQVEGVPELDWLRTLLSRGCLLDVFAYLVEHESPDTLLQLVKRRPANELLHLILPLRTSIKSWRDGRGPGGRTMRDFSRRSPTRSISFFLMITHLRHGDTRSPTPIARTMNARMYSGNDRTNRVR
jgi:hypothetical protein